MCASPEEKPQPQESRPTLLDQPRGRVIHGSRAHLAEILPCLGSPPAASQPAVMENRKLPQAPMWRRKELAECALPGLSEYALPWLPDGVVLWRAGGAPLLSAECAPP
ncbi:hypothetical protein NDU88_004546 [Pleurodeles waltl]|uniref:Uncharacterized protein n=1 Tax=Pleurodeles waltl TaxID=8319 RepID=A0AAV7RJL0_PLEWA|nr:hypothetical protein NDU88_004546 [Pleurodeles waltl]